MAANLMALLANIHRGKGKPAYRAEDFNPFVKRSKAKGSIHDFKAFLRKRGEVNGHAR